VGRKAIMEPEMTTARSQTRKRTYRSPGQFLSDIWFLSRRLPKILRVRTGKTLPPSFRERLMLAVTSVYGCSICTWIHTREALRRGVDREEVAGLLAGSVDDCPADEAIGVLYAQHWADSDARPDPEAVERLERTYGTDKAELINTTLRMVRVGNLTYNTWRRLLYKITAGRLGE